MYSTMEIVKVVKDLHSSTDSLRVK